jgi:hypothetical protein
VDGEGVVTGKEERDMATEETMTRWATEEQDKINWEPTEVGWSIWGWLIGLLIGAVLIFGGDWAYKRFWFSPPSSSIKTEIRLPLVVNEKADGRIEYTVQRFYIDELGYVRAK